MQIKYIIATIATSIAFDGVTALPTENTDVALLQAREEAANQMGQHVAAIEAAAVQLQEARVAFQSAKLDAAKALIHNAQLAHQAGHTQLQPGEVEQANELVARAEQANQAEAAQAAQQGKQVGQAAQNKACYWGCGGGYGIAAIGGGGYGGAYYAGGGGYAGLSLGIPGLLSLSAGAGAYYGAYGYY